MSDTESKDPHPVLADHDIETAESALLEANTNIKASPKSAGNSELDAATPGGIVPLFPEASPGSGPARDMSPSDENNKDTVVKCDIARTVKGQIDEKTTDNKETVGNSEVASSSTGHQQIIASTTTTISKKQLKRNLQHGRYLEHHKEKRAMEKERKRAKRAAIREAGLVPPPKKPRITLMSESKCFQRVAVDLAYEKQMNEKQIVGVITQLSFCYAANRRATNPLQLSFVNFNGGTRKIFDSKEHNVNWDVKFDERSLYDVYKKDEIVYLTADSNNVLDDLNPSKVYVIGGLLDHNSLKGHCLDVAIKEGVTHARLPIDDYVKMRTRKVLTINQVFEILVRYIEKGSWKEAFFDVIPRRRLAQEELNDKKADTDKMTNSEVNDDKVNEDKDGESEVMMNKTNKDDGDKQVITKLTTDADTDRVTDNGVKTETDKAPDK